MKYQLTAHASKQIEAKGLTEELIQAVWEDPESTYPSHRHPGQHKRIGQGICLCCDDTGKVITVFIHGVITALRPDQVDPDALAWWANALKGLEI